MHFIHKTTVTENARIASDPLVVPNITPLERKCALYTPISAARLARKRRRHTSHPTTLHGPQDEDFLKLQNIKRVMKKHVHITIYLL